MTPDKVSSVSEELVEQVARAMFDCYRGYNAETQEMLWQQSRYGLMRQAERAIECLRSSAPRTSEDAEWLRGLIPYLARHHFASEAIERIERIANTLDCSVK